MQHRGTPKRGGGMGITTRQRKLDQADPCPEMLWRLRHDIAIEVFGHCAVIGLGKATGHAET